MPRASRGSLSRAEPPNGIASGADAEDAAAATAPQRLDKWLWFARLTRTRTLAARLVEAGKVRVNREKVLKPAHSIKPGDVITAALGGRVRVARVVDTGKRRGPAEEARGLYEDLTPPMESAPSLRPGGTGAPARAGGSGRPTKRDRRKLDGLRAKQDGGQA